MRYLILCVSLVALAGCGQTRIIREPVVTTVTERVYLPIPSDLTKPCALSEIVDSMTYAESLAAWSEDRASVKTCNARLGAIDELVKD